MGRSAERADPRAQAALQGMAVDQLPPGVRGCGRRHLRARLPCACFLPLPCRHLSQPNTLFRCLGAYSICPLVLVCPLVQSLCARMPGLSRRTSCSLVQSCAHVHTCSTRPAAASVSCMQFLGAQVQSFKSRVLFRDACAAIPADAVLLEVGPHAIMRAPLRQVP